MGLQPTMTFDLGSPVGDVAWEPGSATTFAAVTEEGRVVVYDLAIDKRQPLCEQRIVSKGQLTHLAFNSVHPVMLVGDDRHVLCCFPCFAFLIVFFWEEKGFCWKGSGFLILLF